MSVKIKSASAPINFATMADKLSLSPYTISSMATASFSLITGIAPKLNVSSKAFIRFSLHSKLSTSLLVIKNCPIV